MDGEILRVRLSKDVEKERSWKSCCLQIPSMSGTQWSWSSPAFKNDPPLHDEKNWRFPEMGVSPIAGWFIMEHPVKMDDLGVALFQETS